MKRSSVVAAAVAPPRLVLSLLLTLIVVLSIWTASVEARPRPIKNVNKPQPQTKKIVINEDKLPNFEDLLKEIEVTQCAELLKVNETATCLEFHVYYPNFVKMGAYNTKMLLRLQSMDYNIMEYEWAGFTKNHTTILKAKSAELTLLAAEEEVKPARKDIEERNRLKFGHIFLDNAAQNIEFTLSDFGGPTPMDALDYVYLDDYPMNFGCFAVLPKPNATNATSTTAEVKVEGEKGINEVAVNAKGEDDDLSGFNLDAIIGPDSSSGNGTEREVKLASFFEYPSLPVNFNELAGKAWIVKRGNCTVFEKALAAKMLNASALIIANSFDKLESFASGVGAQGTLSVVTEDDVLSIKAAKLPIITISNVSLPKLLQSQGAGLFAKPNKLNFIPLKCTSAACLPVTPEEKLKKGQVTWGNLDIFDSDDYNSKYPTKESFEFLTSNFGGSLPCNDESLKIVYADPFDGCEPLLNSAEEVRGSVVMMARGNCRFEVKLSNAQAAGARLAVVINSAGEALQRIGYNESTFGHVGIPSVLVSSTAEDYFGRRISQFQSTMNSATIGSSSTSSSSSSDEVDNNEMNINNNSDCKSKNNILSSKFIAKIRCGAGSDRTENWINIALTEWHDDYSDRIMQVATLVNKYNEIGHADLVDFLMAYQNKLQQDLSEFGPQGPPKPALVEAVTETAAETAAADTDAEKGNANDITADVDSSTKLGGGDHVTVDKITSPA